MQILSPLASSGIFSFLACALNTPSVARADGFENVPLVTCQSHGRVSPEPSGASSGLATLPNEILIYRQKETEEGVARFKGVITVKKDELVRGPLLILDVERKDDGDSTVFEKKDGEGNAPLFQLKLKTGLAGENWESLGTSAEFTARFTGLEALSGATYCTGNAEL